jgi:acetolactate synthase-1/2/3 large subunit
MSTTEGQGTTITVGSALAASLARSGVKIAFTVPSESILGIIDGLAAHGVRVVATRHEGAASFMAEAVAQLTSRPTVCLAGRAPGAANLAIGLQAAQADSAPVVAIVGQVRRDVRGRDAFQEMDIVSTFTPFVKWAVEARDAAEVIPLAERALATAMRGRPGPVLLSIPEDLFDEVITATSGTAPAAAANHPDQHAEPDPALVRKVLHLLTDARRPVILAGAGILRARSTDALVRLAEQLEIPVVTSWRRPDAFPNENPLYLGMTGAGAPSSVLRRLREADAMLVLGCRLSESTTFGYRIPEPHTRWAQVDVEPRSGGADSRPELVMASDAAGFLRVARRVLSRAALEASSLEARRAANAADRAAYEAASVVDGQPWDGPGVHPGRVVDTLRRVLPPEAIVTTDAGDFGTWLARGFRFHRPGTFIGPTSGSMGFGLPAAIAASLVRPGRLGVAVAGDGGFAMAMAELETAVRERAHVVALVFDNGRYGTIWRHQEQRGGEGGLATTLGPIDFAAVANAAGALGLTVSTDSEFEPALRQAMEAGRPAVLHLALDPSWTTPEAAAGEVLPERLRQAEVAPAITSDQTVEETAHAEAEATPDPLVIEETAQVGVESTADEPSSESEAAPEPEAQPEAEPTAEPEAQPEAEPTAEPEPEPEAEPTDEPAGEPEPEAQLEPRAEAEPEPEPAAEPAAEPEGPASS